MRYLFILTVCLLVAGAAHAQGSGIKKDRVLLVVNASAPMLSVWQGDKLKYDAATDMATRIIEEVYKNNEEVEFGLRVYGHQFSSTVGNCKDSRREVPFAKDALAQITLRLKDIRPKGIGSVEYALDDAAANDLTDTAGYRYSIIVITDSSRYCPDNICLPVSRADKANVLFKGFVVDLSGRIVMENRYECFDQILPVVNDYGMDTAVLHIARHYPAKKKEKEVKIVYETKPTPRAPFQKVVSKPAAAVSPPPPVVADTVTKQPAKPQETIVIRKESRIKSEIDEFGYLQLINTSIVGRIIIYRIEKETQVQTNEVYPVGMNEIKVKLKTGDYRIVYNIAGIAEGARTFTIKNEETTELMFR